MRQSHTGRQLSRLAVRSLVIGALVGVAGCGGGGGGGTSFTPKVQLPGTDVSLAQAQGTFTGTYKLDSGDSGSFSATINPDGTATGLTTNNQGLQVAYSGTYTPSTDLLFLTASFKPANLNTSIVQSCTATLRLINGTIYLLDAQISNSLSDVGSITCSRPLA